MCTEEGNADLSKELSTTDANTNANGIPWFDTNTNNNEVPKRNLESGGDGISKEENFEPNESIETDTENDTSPWCFHRFMGNKAPKNNPSKSFQVFFKTLWNKLTSRKVLFPDEVELSGYQTEDSQKDTQINDENIEPETTATQNEDQNRRLDFIRSDGKINLVEENNNLSPYYPATPEKSDFSVFKEKFKALSSTFAEAIRSSFSVLKGKFKAFLSTDAEAIRSSFSVLKKNFKPIIRTIAFLHEFLNNNNKPKRNKSLYAPINFFKIKKKKKQPTTTVNSESGCMRATKRFLRPTCKANPRSSKTRILRRLNTQQARAAASYHPHA